MIIVSDIHGDYEWIARLAESRKDELIVQLGDFGFGFRKFPNTFSNNLKFFCGNHDNRSVAEKHPNCLGPFGEYDKFFFVSGADSIDKSMRVPGLSWWPDEELNARQADYCMTWWKNCNKKILICHDAPQFIVENYFLIYDRSFTRQLIQRMIEIRKPEFVIFGHHHRKFSINLDDVCYRGLAEKECFYI